MEEPDGTIHTRVAIIGSGFGGLGMAIRLVQEGISDFLIFERADELGGVWRDNRYPGAACDVQSHLYSFSFAPNPDWSRRFSPQSEIWEYLRRVAREKGILPSIRFGHRVTGARWNDRSARWEIATTGGAYTSSILVAAPGALSEPHVPQLPGMDLFRGRCFHSARWPDDLDLDGQRVAVIGTGASAIQIVPAIQPQVKRLYLFQRTPAWVVPRRDRAFGERLPRLLRRLPAIQRLLRGSLFGTREMMGLLFRHPRLARIMERSARRHLRRQIPDPELRRLLTPSYTLGCKRILVSDDFYPALLKSNVEVVGGGATAVSADGVVGADGRERQADVIVFSTGFEVTTLPFARRVRGSDGRSLAEIWGPSPQAHLGTTVNGFPNFFLLQGPNTGLGHTSVVLMIEAQVEHVIHALRFMDAYDIESVEPRAEAQQAFVREVDRMMEATVWTTGGCRSWYLDASGRNSTLWPGSVRSFARRVEPFRPAEYHLVSVGEARAEG